MGDGEVVGRQAPRNATGQSASTTTLTQRFAVSNEHVARSSNGRGLSSVDGNDFAVWPPNEHKATTADAGVLPIHNAQRQSHGNCCIHGITSLLKHTDSSIGSDRMDGGNHAIG